MKPATFLFAIISGAITILIMAVFASAILRNGNDTTVKSVDYASEYATSGSSVKITQIGATKSEEDHRQMTVTVSSVQRKIEVTKGYIGTPLKSQIFNNNMEAYKAFLIQLDNDGFFEVKKLKAGATIDDAKSCSDGIRYKLELIDNKNTVLTNWGSSCGRGSFRGNSIGQVLDDFTNQIPGYDDIVRDVDL